MHSIIYTGLVALYLPACLPTVDFGSFEPPSPQRDTIDPRVLEEPVSVVRVKDGDTIVVRVEGLEESIRLRGVDTPELFPEPAEPFALAAKNFTTQAVGTQVELEFDSGCPPPHFENCRDIYDRLLAYVRLADGTDLGAALLEAGLAVVYVFGESFDKQAEYEALEEAAQAAAIGLWGP